jgi:hypothetical protein
MSIPPRFPDLGTTPPPLAGLPVTNEFTRLFGKFPDGSFPELETIVEDLIGCWPLKDL